MAPVIHKTGYRRLCVTLALLLSAYGCSQLVPAHNIRAKPEYIRVGVQAGDRVEITTKDGEYSEFVVVDVGNDTIEGLEGTIQFSDIEKIVKRSWKEPDHPCGGGMPVGCSIPEVVLLLSGEYKRQAEKFHPACVTHDFCYRHGVATYGVTRDECDTVFYDDMKKACKGMGNLDVLDIVGYGECQVAANQTYEAVRRRGEQHFQTTSSSYCEFRDEP